MNDMVIINAFGAAGAKLYSTPIKVGDQLNALQVALTLFSGSVATSNAVVVEMSNDLVNWSSSGATQSANFNALTGPNYAQANVTGVSARYARVVVTMGTGAGIVNVSAAPNRV